MGDDVLMCMSRSCSAPALPTSVTRERESIWLLTLACITGFESAAFKLSHEMTQLLDPGSTRQSTHFKLFEQLCIRGYLVVSGLPHAPFSPFYFFSFLGDEVGLIMSIVF